MKKLITLFGIASCGVFFAQTGDVGINTSMPHSNAVLDVVSTNKGNNSIDVHCFTIPLSAHVVGMLVYNTATVNDV